MFLQYIFLPAGINPGERGLKLLLVLSSVFPWHFLDADVLRQIIGLLSISNPDPAVAPLALSVLTYVGKHQPLGDAFPDLMATLVSVCVLKTWPCVNLIFSIFCRVTIVV